MVANSSLFECTVMHKRFKLIERMFFYRYFMFYLDLDEIDEIAASRKLFSRNRFNVFSFRDRDHLVYDRPDVKKNLKVYLNSNGIVETGKIYLLTNVATFGYNFNPVSFYFCFDMDGNPLCAVPEVGNTFGELKPFFLGIECLEGLIYTNRITKNFYVSPFIAHNAEFDFQLSIPSDTLSIKIDDYLEDKRIFITQLSGKKIELTDYNLVKYAIIYPFVTLKIIGAIHFQALLLILRKVPFFKKNEYLELQKGFLRKWKKL